MKEFPIPPLRLYDTLLSGIVIPAHPLALTDDRKLDERRQRALTRYYHAAGAGGIAVGVHTTQFAIRDHDLLLPVLELASETARVCDASTNRNTVLIAGICGQTEQAHREAQLAYALGYDAGLLSLSALPDATDSQLIEHCVNVAEIIPLFGFYLQPAVGGRVLSTEFWRRFASIPNVVGIKIAPFNRYRTLDVARAVAEVGRADAVALYTGNDDHIVGDLLSEYTFDVDGTQQSVHIAGGLLGHWACWTHKAVELLAECRRQRGSESVRYDLLRRAEQITDCNAAFFDAANDFKGCIPGIHEVLRRQGLLANLNCIDPNERLSPGQMDEIDRVYNAYPQLNDDAFVAAHLDEWLTP